MHPLLLSCPIQSKYKKRLIWYSASQATGEQQTASWLREDQINIQGKALTTCNISFRAQVLKPNSMVTSATIIMVFYKFVGIIFYDWWAPLTQSDSWDFFG